MFNHLTSYNIDVNFFFCLVCFLFKHFLFDKVCAKRKKNSLRRLKFELCKLKNCTI